MYGASYSAAVRRLRVSASYSGPVFRATPRGPGPRGPTPPARIVYARVIPADQSSALSAMPLLIVDMVATEPACEGQHPHQPRHDWAPLIRGGSATSWDL